MIKIVKYQKKFEKDINKLLIKQWNEQFKHDKNVLGEIALVDGVFAGCCIGCKKSNYYILKELCVVEDFRNMKVGTMLLNSFINNVKTQTLSGVDIVAYLLDNDGRGPNLPRAKRMFEKFNFNFVEVIDGYFAKDNNYEYCPDCKSKPCKCSAWKYVLKL